MSRNRRHLLLFAFALLFFYRFQNLKIQSSQPDKSTSSSTTSFVIRVIDGDTIEIETGERVRYIGMNTPETIDPRREVQCFGKEASEYNKKLVLNKKVRLEKDISATDKYGRLLRYAYLEDGTFVNLKLVKNGYAFVATYPPDVAYSDEFVVAERQAREAGAGLWSVCKDEQARF